MLVIGLIVGVILVLPATAIAVARHVPRQHRWIVRWFNQLRMWLQDVAMMPKLKIAIGFFQTITFTPDVYGLALPEWYYDWTQFLNVFQSALQYFKPFPQEFADSAFPCVQLIGRDSPYLGNVSRVAFIAASCSVGLVRSSSYFSSVQPAGRATRSTIILIVPRSILRSAKAVRGSAVYSRRCLLFSFSPLFLSRPLRRASLPRGRVQPMLSTPLREQRPRFSSRI